MSEFVIGMLTGAGLLIVAEVVIGVVIARSLGKWDDEAHRFDDWD